MQIQRKLANIPIIFYIAATCSTMFQGFMQNFGNGRCQRISGAAASEASGNFLNTPFCEVRVYKLI